MCSTTPDSIEQVLTCVGGIGAVGRWRIGAHAEVERQLGSSESSRLEAVEAETSVRRILEHKSMRLEDAQATIARMCEAQAVAARVRAEPPQDEPMNEDKPQDSGTEPEPYTSVTPPWKLVKDRKSLNAVTWKSKPLRPKCKAEVRHASRSEACKSRYTRSGKDTPVKQNPWKRKANVFSTFVASL